MYTRSPHRAHPYGQHGSGGADGDDWLGGDLQGAGRGRRRTRILFALLALCVAAVTVAALAWVYWPNSSLGAGEAPRNEPFRQPGSPKASRTRPAPAVIPGRGTGKFLRAPGSTRKVGRGTLLRYVVEVEGGIGQRAAGFARTVDRILSDQRGWTAGGRWAFQRVDSADYDFVVRLAAPRTVDKICARYGLDTESQVNCAGGRDVVINLKRWILLTPFYKGKPELYRALAVNHEVGHRLGFGHMKCPRKGAPAPVMQQQIYGMRGCVVNGWPYDARSRFITGPPTR